MEGYLFAAITILTMADRLAHGLDFVDVMSGRRMADFDFEGLKSLSYDMSADVADPVVGIVEPAEYGIGFYLCVHATSKLAIKVRPRVHPRQSPTALPTSTGAPWMRQSTASNYC